MELKTDFDFCETFELKYLQFGVASKEISRMFRSIDSPSMPQWIQGLAVKKRSEHIHEEIDAKDQISSERAQAEVRHEALKQKLATLGTPTSRAGGGVQTSFDVPTNMCDAAPQEKHGVVEQAVNSTLPSTRMPSGFLPTLPSLSEWVSSVADPSTMATDPQCTLLTGVQTTETERAVVEACVQCDPTTPTCDHHALRNSSIARHTPSKEITKAPRRGTSRPKQNAKRKTDIQRRDVCIGDSNV